MSSKHNLSPGRRNEIDPALRLSRQNLDQFGFQTSKRRAEINRNLSLFVSLNHLVVGTIQPYDQISLVNQRDAGWNRAELHCCNRCHELDFYFIYVLETMSGD